MGTGFRIKRALKQMDRAAFRFDRNETGSRQPQASDLAQRACAAGRTMALLPQSIRKPDVADLSKVATNVANQLEIDFNL
jgi:hypothetical protein